MAAPNASPGRRGSRAAEDRPAAPADRRWLVLVVVAIAQLMVVLDSTIVNIALPSAQHALGVPEQRPAVGGDGLRAGVRQPAVGGRPPRRHVQPQVGLHHRPGRIRARLSPRGRRRLVRDAGRGPGAAGGIRRHPRAVRPRHPGQYLPGPARAGKGLRGLRLSSGRRWRGGLDPRRGPHPVPLVAIHPVRQPGLRRDRHHRRAGLYPQHPIGQPAANGLARSDSGLRRAVPHRLRLLPRRDRRLDGRADYRQPGRRRDRTGRVCAGRAAGQPSTAAAAGGPGPHPGRSVRRGLPVRNRNLRRLPVLDLLHAGGQGEQPVQHGPAVPAADRLHPDQLQSFQHCAAAQGRPARPDRVGHAAGCDRDDLPEPGSP